MANKNFEIKNGLTIAGTERISSAGAFSGSLASGVTATTQSSSDNSTKIATTAYTDAAITAVIGGAPGTLDTLNELAAAINDDASYATTLTTALATKAPLASPTFTGALTIDDITIDGSTISDAGDIAIDAGGDIILDADGADIQLKDGGTHFGNLTQGSNNAFIIKSVTGDSDIFFQGVDGSTAINALQLDMSDSGYAYFNRGIDIKAADGKRLRFTDADGTFRGGIQAVEGGGQMIATTAQHDIAIRSQSNLLFSSGGNTERMRIASSSGNVGIGITNPATTLHLDASGGAVLRMQRTSANASNKLELSHDGTDGTITSTNDLILSADTVNVGNNKPVWSGSYGGALFLKGDNATSDRYARICTVDSTGAAINNGLTVNNNGSTTIDCGEAYSLNVSGNGTGLRFSTGSNQRIYWNTHRAIEGAADGSQLQVGEGFTTLLVQSREKYIVDGATYGKVIIRFNATTSGDRLTAVTANLNTLLGLSTSDYGQWTVEFGGYAGSGTNGLTGSFTIGGYTGHNYSATNHNSYGAGTINVGYDSSGGASTGVGPLTYHPVQNNGMYIANGEVWVYVPAAQQVGIMIKNNGSQNLAGTMIVTAAVRG